MHDDEQAIRDLIATWLRVSAEGDVAQLAGLMAEDVVFLVPGQSPMRGREAFLAAFRAGAGQYRIEGHSEVEEIEVAGDLAYCWTRLSVTAHPLHEGSPTRRSGNTLSILRRKPEGGWVLFRDANLLTVEPAG
ncbi:MAG TPA: SgcJ/EcaC family oxidoreductase [Thermoanaerobaculia bacterium]|nr:SgcJ/EcaC family oxidoreductase [Thermoanaerobaculia bacterium]